MDELALGTRTGLPDALRVLIERHPRDGWQDLMVRQADFRRFQRLLDRHLTDEEELVVPVILEHGELG